MCLSPGVKGGGCPPSSCYEDITTYKYPLANPCRPRGRWQTRRTMATSTTTKLSANGTLLHRQLFVLLRQQIQSGRLRTGEQLPTQDALCREFSVSRITV